MRLRRAIKRAKDIVADCPHNGTCSLMQCHRGVMWLSCNQYQGVVEDERQGTMVKCGLDGEVDK